MKRLHNIGYLGYLSLFVLAIVFYKERTFYIDGAFYTFELVRTNDFAVFHSRYIAGFAEALALLARKLNADLAFVAASLSVGFVLVPFTCYWLCGVMKKYEYGLILLLYNILMTADSFYFVTSELPLGVAFLLLMFAFIDYRESKNLLITFLINSILVFFIVTAHPLIIFPISYMLVFMLVHKKQQWVEAVILTILTAIMVVIKMKFFTDDYEANSSSNISKLLNSHYIDIPSHKVLLKNFFYKFYWLPVLSLLTAIVLYRRRKFILLTWFVLYMCCFTLLINIVYPEKTGEDYIENFYLLLVFFMAVPLILVAVPPVQRRIGPSIILFVIIVSGALRIYAYHDRYTARINWERAYLKEVDVTKKYLISGSKVPMDKFWLIWGTPYEFWLLSTIEQGRTASVTITDNVDGTAWGAAEQKSFLPTWGIFKYSELPAKYFIFKDTTNGYTIIK